MRATEWGSLAALSVMLIMFFGVYGGWRDVSFSWAEIWERNRHVDWSGFWGFDPLRTSIVLGVAAGALVRFLVLLRTFHCWALDARAEDAHDDPGAEERGYVAPRLNPSCADAAGNDKKTAVLDAFVRCSDLAMAHAIRLPVSINPRDKVQDNEPRRFQAFADLPEELAKYLAYYMGDHDGKFLANQVTARRTAWFNDRRIAVLLDDGTCKDAISIDSTLRDLLAGLADGYTCEAMVQAGLLAEKAPGHLAPPLALLQNAPIFPHYDQRGRTVALSHSLSPILGEDCDDMLWDRQEIHKAGLDDGVLYITSGIHFGSHLRLNGFHAIAIHPHVWAHPELARTWPLPRFVAAKLRYGDYPEYLRRTERFANWLTRQICELNVRRVEFDLSDNFTALTDDETLTHRMMVRFLFRHFVSRYLAPGLKAAGIEVVSPDFQPWLLMRRLLGCRPRIDSPAYVLDRVALFDLEGESALFELEQPILAPEEVRVAPRAAPPDATAAPESPVSPGPTDESTPEPGGEAAPIHLAANVPPSPEPAPPLGTIPSPVPAQECPEAVPQVEVPDGIDLEDPIERIQAAEENRSCDDYYPCKMIQRPNGKWLIVFGSECSTFRNLSGVRYMAALFSHPNKYILAKDLFDIYKNKFPPPDAWVSAPNDEIPGKGLPLEWRRKPRLIKWRNTRLISLIEREFEYIEDRYTPGEEFEVIGDGVNVKASRRQNFTAMRAELTERKINAQRTLDVVTPLCDSDPYVKRVGKNLRFIRDKFRDKNLLMLAAYIQDTVSPFEFIRLGYKPERGAPPELQWTVEWANKDFTHSIPLDESDDSD